MGKLKCVQITTNAFNSLSPKDGDTLYFVNDTGTFGPDSSEADGLLYLGDKLISSQPSINLYNGLKVYYNGNDVTNDVTMLRTVANARKHWYGSTSQYVKMELDHIVENGVAYHLIPNPDWEESDEDSLSYIQNKPNIMDASVFVIGNNQNGLCLFYK